MSASNGNNGAAVSDMKRAKMSTNGSSNEESEAILSRVLKIVDESKRGRIMALFQICWAGLVPFGGLGMGSIASEVGLMPTLVGGGVICVLYAVGVVASAGRLEPQRA